MKKFINQLPFKKTIILSLIVLFVFSAPMIMFAVEQTNSSNVSVATQNNNTNNGNVKQNLSKKALLEQGLAYQQADGSVKLHEPIEDKAKRSKNSKSYLTGFTTKGTPTYKGRFYGSDIHYFNNEANTLENIDTNLVDHLDKWQMTKANYHVQLSKKLEDNFITFHNQGQELYFSLLEYPNNTITAKKNNKEKDKWQNKQAIYEDALGGGIDLEVGLDIEKLVKEVVIESKESLGDLTGKEYYEIPFKLTSNRNIDIKLGDQLLSEVGTITTNQAVEIIDDEGGLSSILAPRAEDSSDDIMNNFVNIEIAYTLTDNGIIMTKKLPIEWLNTAVYPIRTDAVIKYYSDIETGGNGVDGLINVGWKTTWSEARDATFAPEGGVDETSSTNYASAAQLISNYNVMRGFFHFDTSDIDDNALITSATFKLYVASNDSNDNDDDDFMVMLESFVASSSNLVGDDFDQCGLLNNPTELSNQVDLSSGITIDEFNGWTINSTGIDKISKTGITKFCIRSGHDINNNPLNFNTYDRMSINYTDYFGTTTDPYLEIEWTLSPLMPTNLKVEGENNPIKVTDGYPEFYAVYNDTDNTDVAVYYQIQVSASSTYWGDTEWDSEKILMATTTEDTYCPLISYGASNSLAFDGSTYYWRIKFWDDEDNEGEWSDVANFTMANSVRVEFP